MQSTVPVAIVETGGYSLMTGRIAFADSVSVASAEKVMTKLVAGVAAAAGLAEVNPGS